MYQKAKFLFFFLTLTIVLSNDGDFRSKVEYNSTSIDAWFKKYNNYGLKRKKILLESSYTTKINDKLGLSLNILISPNDFLL